MVRYRYRRTLLLVDSTIGYSSIAPSKIEKHLWIVLLFHFGYLFLNYQYLMTDEVLTLFGSHDHLDHMAVPVTTILTSGPLYVRFKNADYEDKSSLMRVRDLLGFEQRQLSVQLVMVGLRPCDMKDRVVSCRVRNATQDRDGMVVRFQLHLRGQNNGLYRKQALFLLSERLLVALSKSMGADLTSQVGEVMEVVIAKGHWAG